MLHPPLLNAASCLVGVHPSASPGRCGFTVPMFASAAASDVTFESNPDEVKDNVEVATAPVDIANAGATVHLFRLPVSPRLLAKCVIYSRGVALLTCQCGLCRSNR